MFIIHGSLRGLACSKAHKHEMHMVYGNEFVIVEEKTNLWKIRENPQLFGKYKTTAGMKCVGRGCKENNVW